MASQCPRFRQTPRAIASHRAAVERVEAYVRAHLDTAIPVSELCQIVGLSERGLRNAFYAVHGVGPKRWMLAERLFAAQTALSEPQSLGTTVTAVATDYGFCQLGRFAAIYREIFGEAPSVTLRVATRPRGPSTKEHERHTPMFVRANAEMPDRSVGCLRDPVGQLQELDGSVPRQPRIEPRSDDLFRRDVPEQLIKATLVGQSSSLRRVLDQIQLVAVTDSTVLLLGETGVGKEVLATHLHEMSARRWRRMVRVNCSAIPSTLIESELFGREKGAFTGSLARQIGRFELADHSTIFLDEIGDLPADVQVKLLRVLEERQIERLGSPQRIRVDVRIVAATHRKLEERIVEGAFREDLFYRLNVFPITVPPLRDRAEDIPVLVWLFVDEFGRAFGKRIDAIPRDNMDALQRHSWPGNIRELRNVVERAMILATGPRLTIPLPVRPNAAKPLAQRSLKMVDVEKEHVRSVLEMTGWRIRGPAGAAELLGFRPTTLETRMTKLGLHRPRAVTSSR